jgi:hypothetical protein
MKRIVFLVGLFVALAVSPSIAEARGCRSSCGRQQCCTQTVCSAPCVVTTPCVATTSCCASTSDCGHHGRCHARRGRAVYSCGSGCY